MEADDPYPYPLAHVMTTRGAVLDSSRLGDDTATGEEQLHVHVDGEPATPELVLQDGDVIVVAHGTEDCFPGLPPADARENA